MTIRRGAVGYCLYAAAANQEARLSHMTCGIIVNKYSGQWTKSIYSYQHFPLVPGHRGEQRLLIASLKFIKPLHTHKTLF